MNKCCKQWINFLIPKPHRYLVVYLEVDLLSTHQDSWKQGSERIRKEIVERKGRESQAKAKDYGMTGSSSDKISQLLSMVNFMPTYIDFAIPYRKYGLFLSLTAKTSTSLDSARSHGSVPLTSSVTREGQSRGCPKALRFESHAVLWGCWHLATGVCS